MAVFRKGLKAARPGLSYEEVEKRRSEELAGESQPRRGGGIFLLAFLAFAVLTVYLFIGSSVGIAPVGLIVPEVTSLLAAGSLLGYRFQTRGRRQPGGSVKPVVVDVLALLGIVGLAAWTFAFPLLYPLPQQTAVIGVYSLILIAAMIVVLRFAAPGLRGRPDDGYADIEASLQRLGKAVDSLSRRAPQEKSTDPAVADRLSAMMGEVAAMKKELSSIKSGGGVLPSSSGGQSVRVYAPSVKPVLVAARAQARGSQPGGPAPSTPSGAGSASPSGAATWTPQEGISVPDSTVDNPWLDVLAKRRAKKEGGAQAGNPQDR